jgi:uncharacterized protein (DUF433 family)
MQADSVVENYEDGSPVKEIADNFDIPEDIVRELLAYDARQDLGIRCESSVRPQGYKAAAKIPRWA